MTGEPSFEIFTGRRAHSQMAEHFSDDGHSRRRQHLVGVRLTPAEHALVQAEAQRSGKSAPAVLRDAFLASVKAGITPGPPRSDLRTNEVPGGARA